MLLQKVPRVKIKCLRINAAYTNKVKIGIAKLKISKSLSIHTVIPLSRPILFSKSYLFCDK